MPESGGLIVIDGEDAGAGTPWEWTGIENNGGTTFTLSDTAKYHGTYGYLLTNDGTNTHSFGWYEVGDQTTLYARCYIYVDQVALGTGDDELLFGLYDGPYAPFGWCIYIGMQTNADPGEFYRWRIRAYNLASTYSTTNFSVNAWHYVDLYFKSDVAGEVGVWVDGESVYSPASYDTSAAIPDRVICGQIDNNATPLGATDYVYFDDIKVATTGPIGAYSESGGGGGIVKQTSGTRARRKRTKSGLILL